MSSSKIRPEADSPSAVDTDSAQMPGTFLRNVLKSHSDRLYDLPENIQDVMGLQALRPSRSHRRRAKEIAASMSQGVSASKKEQAYPGS